MLAAPKVGQCCEKLADPGFAETLQQQQEEELDQYSSYYRAPRSPPYVLVTPQQPTCPHRKILNIKSMFARYSFLWGTTTYPRTPNGFKLGLGHNLGTHEIVLSQQELKRPGRSIKN